MDKVRFAIVGCSKEAQLYAKAVSESNGAQLVAVCEKDEQKRDEFAQLFTLSSRDTILDAITYDHIDAIIIAGDSSLHYTHTIEALEGGVHVLVETPTHMSTNQCTQVISVAQEAQKVLSVVSQHRWFPSAMRIREAIDSGKLKNIVSGEVTLLANRDEEYDKSNILHHIDLLSWFLGPMEQISGKWDPSQESDDDVNATITFENGAVVSFVMRKVNKTDQSTTLHLSGEDQASVGIKTHGNAMDTPVNDIWAIEGEKELLQHFKDQDIAFFHSIDTSSYFLTLQIEDMVRAITTSSTPLVTGEDGREAVKILEALQRGDV